MIFHHEATKGTKDTKNNKLLVVLGWGGFVPFVPSW